MTSSPVIRLSCKQDVVDAGIDTHGASFRGITVSVNGKVAGVTGVILSTPLQLFSTVDDMLRKYPKMFVRVGRMLRSMLKSYQAPVFAKPDANVPQAERYLEWIGFKPTGNGLYVWVNEDD